MHIQFYSLMTSSSLGLICVKRVSAVSAVMRWVRDKLAISIKSPLNKFSLRLIFTRRNDLLKKIISPTCCSTPWRQIIPDVFSRRDALESFVDGMIIFNDFQWFSMTFNDFQWLSMIDSDVLSSFPHIFTMSFIVSSDHMEEKRLRPLLYVRPRFNHLPSFHSMLVLISSRHWWCPWMHPFLLVIDPINR